MNGIEQAIQQAPELYQLAALVAFTLIGGGISALIVHSDKGSENFKASINSGWVDKDPLH